MYICIHSPPNPRPIQVDIYHWTVFHTLYSRFLLVICLNVAVCAWPSQNPLIVPSFWYFHDIYFSTFASLTCVLTNPHAHCRPYILPLYVPTTISIVFALDSHFLLCLSPWLWDLSLPKQGLKFGPWQESSES